MPKVVAISGSPSGEKGATDKILAALVEGMTDAGADVQTYYPASMDIRPCTCGVMHCWYRRPGECCIQDDMQEMYTTLVEAETLVLATPVYIPLPAAMQSFINRMCPLIVPRLETRDGRTRARFRDGVSISRIALVSTGDWWEMGNFGTVARIAEELAENASVPFAGAVLRPHVFLMWRDGALTPEGEAVLAAVRSAGHELARDGVMKDETLERVARPLISREDLIALYNRWV